MLVSFRELMEVIIQIKFEHSVIASFQTLIEDKLYLLFITKATSLDIISLFPRLQPALYSRWVKTILHIYQEYVIACTREGVGVNMMASIKQA